MSTKSYDTFSEKLRKALAEQAEQNKKLRKKDEENKALAERVEKLMKALAEQTEKNDEVLNPPDQKKECCVVRVN